MLAFMKQAEDTNRLFGGSVASIIEAYNAEPRTRLLATQAAAAESLQPYAVRAQVGQIEHQELQNALLRASNPIAIETAQIDLANKRELGTLPRQLVEAKLAEALGNVNGRVDIPLVNPDGTPKLGPDGKQLILPNVPSSSIYDTLYGRIPGGLTEEHKITNARNARLDEAKLIEEAKRDEEVILGTKTTSTGIALGMNAEDPAIQPRLDSFNSKSLAPYAYVWAGGQVIPSTGLGVINPWSTNTVPEKAYKVTLPRNKEHGQLTARRAYKNATKLNLTMKEYLEALRGQGKITEKLPWQQR